MSFHTTEKPTRWARMTRRWVCSAFIAGAVAACTATAQDNPASTTTAAANPAIEVYFGPKFKQDHVVVYEFQAENISVQTQSDMDMIDSTYTESVMRFTVNKVHEDGSADLTMTYDRIFTQGEAYFGGTYLFDSTAEQADAETDARITTVLKRLANATVTFHADAQGNVDPATVQGTADIVESMKDLTALAGRMGEFNAEGLAELFESTWRVGNETYTRDVTKPWTDVQKTPVEGLGTWTFTSDYQLLDQDPKEVVLGMKMVMQLEFQPPEETIEGMLKILETKFDMLKGDWRYVWDRENHELVQRSGEIEFKWLIVQEGLFEGDIVRTDQHQHVKSTIKRVAG